MKNPALLYEVTFFSALCMVFPESQERSFAIFYAHDCNYVKLGRHHRSAVTGPPESMGTFGTNPHKFLSNKLILYSSHRADNGPPHSFVPTKIFCLPVALCQAHVNWHFIWI